MRRVFIAALAAGALIDISAAQAAELDCRRARWDGHTPAINVGHIFCGEFRQHPDGYHSEAIFPTPLVSGVTGRQEIGRGLYNATVLFSDGERKFSTFYPRACTVDMVLRSIRYAVSQPRTPKRMGWGFVAASAPPDAKPDDGYCLGSDAAPFMIRYALLSRGDVNTAFPDGPGR
jgi:hypothetical protein